MGPPCEYGISTEKEWNVCDMMFKGTLMGWAWYINECAIVSKYALSNTPCIVGQL